ncbi:type II toxin-antitoxin system VapC family toxin [Thermococcus sp.]|uniref:type II toxin-antitoxin system VapC family toxin n=1 Tax=Thermococcus sp. TaxID=35749 RepID=UPI00262EC9D2|nr:type II toxin-antitoxin system VapC family toxin [Thermococcus sp.]
MSRSEVFIDSSVFMGLLLGDEKAESLVKKILKEGYKLVINPVVFSETVYKVMFKLAIGDGLKGVHDLRKHLENHLFVYEKVKDAFEKMEDAGFLNVLEVSPETIRTAAQLGKEYELLPNDAIIVTSCKEHGVEKIAIFDSDFERALFLKIMGAD